MERASKWLHRCEWGEFKGRRYGAGWGLGWWKGRNHGCGRGLHVPDSPQDRPGWVASGDEGPLSSGLSQRPTDRRSSGFRLPTLPGAGEDPRVRLRPKVEPKGRGDVKSCLHLPGSSGAPPGGWGAVARPAHPARSPSPVRRVWPAIPESPEYWRVWGGDKEQASFLLPFPTTPYSLKGEGMP